MESPVMTSASSHRLRSAVSACAQPTHSYLNSSYLSTSIQVESHNSGGCLKKFYNSGKNGESSLLNITKKSHTSTDYSPLNKRYKSCSKSGFNHHHRVKNDGREIETSSNRGVLSLIPKQFMLGNHLLSKLNLNRHFLDSTRLADYRDKPATGQSVTDSCEKVISGKTAHKNNKKTTSDTIHKSNANRLLRHPQDGRNKLKSKKRANTAKKDGINEQNQPSDECSKCGVAHSDRSTSIESHQISKWHPKHVVTRRTAQIVREIRNVWQSRVGSSKSVPPEYICLLFQDLQLFPSASQVTGMLEYAKECPGKQPPAVTYKEFCRIANDLIKSDTAVYTKELQETVCFLLVKCRTKEDKAVFIPIDKNYRFKVTKTSPLLRIPDKNEEKSSRKLSRGMSKYEVFLGGSCNPTTWRTDFAIPELERMGISYYNPQQVEKWKPELMEVEYHAKENATVMFFVLDNQTRGVSALIEVAHLAGNRRKLILVVQSYTQKNQIICDEKISNEEYEDLKTGQEVLQDLVQRQGIRVFDDIKVALGWTEKILRENLTVQDLQAPVRVNSENSIDPRDVFEKLDVKSSGEISATDCCLALQMLMGVEVSVSDLKNVMSEAGKDLNGTLLDGVKLDLEDFSQLVLEFRRQLREGALSNLPSLSSCRCCRDVYLGGTIEGTSWRESIAVPVLEEQKLSFFVPRVSEGGRRFTEMEAAAMEHSFILLFAITNTARSIAAMAIAGHYIGKGANVVLCVEHLPVDATIGEEKLSENAVKDYNRGRMYLMDIAERSGVPVFTDISKAVKFVIQKCRNR